MYLPAHFAESRAEVLHGLIRSHPLGVLVTQDRDSHIDANDIPFVLDAAEGDGQYVLRGHVARANPLWRTARGDVESLVVFQGPQGYVSPAWYPSKAEHGKVVPTWNYVVVQGRGALRAIDDRDWVRAFVTRLTERHESDRPAPWAVSDAPSDYIETMLGAIVGIEIVLTSLTGKWKVSQNRPPADREGVAAGLVSEQGDAALAAQVRAFTKTG
jgi:transcriptional regulator